MAFSGPAIHYLGSRGTFGLLSVAPALTLLAAWAMPEPKAATNQKVSDQDWSPELVLKVLLRCYIRAYVSPLMSFDFEA